MTAIQQLRDRAMAKSLLDAPTPALLIAGSFHATKVMGVPLHVTDLAPLFFSNILLYLFLACHCQLLIDAYNLCFIADCLYVR